MVVRLALVAGVRVLVRGVGGVQRLVRVLVCGACCVRAGMAVAVLVFVGMRVRVRVGVGMRVMQVAVPMPVLVHVRVLVRVPVFVRMRMFDVGHADLRSLRVDRTPAGVRRGRVARIRARRKKGRECGPSRTTPAIPAAPQSIDYARQPRPRPGP